MAQYMYGAQKVRDQGCKAPSTDWQGSFLRLPGMTNLGTARVGYKKAYNSMSHTQILECLELYMINRTLRAFIKDAVKPWKINPITRWCSFPTVVLHRLELLSQVIGKTGSRYSLFNGATIYVDDSKTLTQWSTPVEIGMPQQMFVNGNHKREGSQDWERRATRWEHWRQL